MSRTATVTRKTRETNITVTLDLDGSGKADLHTGIGFFDHMLNSFAVHSGFGLTLTCKGDLEVDGHHSVEDCGIALGQALAQCVGDKAGIARFGQAFVPMDEALGFCALDISGRPYLVFDAPMPQPMCGQYDTCLTVEFMRALAVHAGLTLHLKCECPCRTQNFRIDSSGLDSVNCFAFSCEKNVGLKSIPRLLSFAYSTHFRKCSGRSLSRSTHCPASNTA